MTPRPRSGAPPRNERSAPEGPRRCLATDETELNPRGPIAAGQVRRRRVASLRCPPLQSGLRDPLHALACTQTAAEDASWRVTADHLRAHGLFGEWQVPGLSGRSLARVGRPATTVGPVVIRGG